MARVDFYLLPGAHPEQRQAMAARIAEKAWRSGYRIYLHTADAEAALALDILLWAFSPGSFLPHQRLDDGDARNVPVAIGHGEQAPQDRDVLINLAPGLPPQHQQWQRIAEIVLQEAQDEARGREQWRRYKAAGHNLHTRDLRQREPRPRPAAPGRES